MRIEEAAEAVAKFFNDLIGAWVPGAVLTVGLALMHLGPVQLQLMLSLGETALAFLAITGVLFAVGHALLALYEQLLQTLLCRVKISGEWLSEKVPSMKWPSIGPLVKPFNEGDAMKRQSYRWFLTKVQNEHSVEKGKAWDYRDLRSVALSVSTEAASLGRRFMFIALLCRGVGTALAVLAVDFAVCSFFFPDLLFSYKNAAPWFMQVALLLGVSLVLFRHGEAFYSRAMATPFSVAAVEVALKKP